eukprot:7246486-Pyramimonas_sp.AAC.1
MSRTAVPRKEASLACRRARWSARRFWWNCLSMSMAVDAVVAARAAALVAQSSARNAVPASPPGRLEEV